MSAKDGGRDPALDEGAGPVDPTRIITGELTTDAPESFGDETTKSFGVAGWTLVSRVTGLLRVVVAGAILGPTFFANIFQATNTIPNLTYNLMAGSLLTTLIVPILVAELEKSGIEATRKLLRQIVGVIVVGFAVAAAAVVLVSPIIVHLLTIGVHGPFQSAHARKEAWVLLFLVLPQIGLYGIVAAAVAAQNARGHFALAAAAPALENVGLIATLVFVAAYFGRDTRNVSTALPRVPRARRDRCGRHALRGPVLRRGARRAAVVAVVPMDPSGRARPRQARWCPRSAPRRSTRAGCSSSSSRPAPFPAVSSRSRSASTSTTCRSR